MNEKELNDRLDELRTEAREHAQKRDWGLHRNCCYRIADLLRQQEHSERALMALLEVAILDINDPNNIGNTPKHLIGTKLDSGAKIADFTPSRSPGLPPDVSHYILKLSDEVGLSDTALKHKYDEVVQSSWREELGLTPKETWRKVQEELSERA